MSNDKKYICNIKNEKGINCCHKVKVTMTLYWKCQKHKRQLKKIIYNCQEKNDKNWQCCYLILKRNIQHKYWLCQNHFKLFNKVSDNNFNYIPRKIERQVKKLFKEYKEVKNKNEKIKMFNDIKKDIQIFIINIKNDVDDLEIKQKLSQILEALKLDQWANVKYSKFYKLLKDWHSSNYNSFIKNLYIVDTETNSKKEWIIRDKLDNEIDDSKIHLWAFGHNKVFNNPKNERTILNYNDYFEWFKNIKENQTWWVVNLKFDFEYLINCLRNELGYKLIDFNSKSYIEFEKAKENNKNKRVVLDDFLENKEIYVLCTKKDDDDEIYSLTDNLNKSYYNKILKVVIKNENGKIITIEDMYLRIPKSVKDMGNELAKQLKNENCKDKDLLKYSTKMEPPDLCEKHYLDKLNCNECDEFIEFYSVFRPKNHKPSFIELDYISADIIVPKEIFIRVYEIFKEHYNGKFNWKKLTIGSASLDMCKKEYFGVKKWEEYFKNNVSQVLNDFVRKKTFTGGITMGSPFSLGKIFENVNHADIVSAYGKVLADFPIPFGDEITDCITKPNEICKKHYSYYIFNKKLKAKLKPNHLPIFKIDDGNGNKIYCENNPNEFFTKNGYNTIQLKMLLDCYDVDLSKWNFTKIACFNWKVHPELTKWVNDALALKNQGKKENNEIKVMASKLTMLTIFGKLGEKLHLKEHILNNNLEVNSKDKEDDFKFVVGADAITSWGQLLLMSVIQFIGYNRFLKCDTDSVFYIGEPLPIDITIPLLGGFDNSYKVFTNSKELGKWEMTLDKILRFKVIGPKKYMYEYESYKNNKKDQVVKCAGLKAEFHKYLSFETFKPHIEFINVNAKTCRSQINKYTLFDRSNYTIKNVQRSVILYMIKNYSFLSKEWTNELLTMIPIYFGYEINSVLDIEKNLNKVYNEISKIKYLKTEIDFNDVNVKNKLGIFEITGIERKVI